MRTLKDRFSRGSGTYKCQLCGKLTRDTGRDEGSTALCFACYWRCSTENYHSDNSHAGPVEGCHLCKVEMPLPKARR